MDMYRILENFDAVNNKKTLTEGRMKDMLHKKADSMSKEDFVADAGEYGMSSEEATEFWIAVNGDDEELNEGLSPKIKKLIDAYRKLYPTIAYDADGEDLMEPEEAHDETCSRLGVDPSDMDDYFELEDEELNEGLSPKIKKLIDAYRKLYPTIAYDANDEETMEPEEAHDETCSRLGVDPSDMDDYFELEDEELDEERRSEADWDAAAISAGKRGRDARDNPSRHAARAKAGQAMRGNAKPDFLDLDRDGDKTEPMKSAAKGVAEGMLTHRDFEKPDDVDVQKMAKMAAKGLLTYATKTKMNPANLLKKDYYALAAMLEKVNPNLYAAIDDQLSDNDYNWLYFKAADLAANAAAKQGIAEAGKAPFPGTPEYELRFGKTDAGSAFDKKKVSTGTVYSRKHFDEPEAGDDDAPKSAGRPKGTGRKLGAKGPSVASKLLKGKGGLKEHDHEHGMDMHNGLDSGEYDQEGDMAQQDLHTVVDAARELHSILASDENLPEWVQAKITKALDYIDTARDYVKSSHAEQGEESIPEAGYSAKSARAGKDIGKPGKNFAKIAKGAAERYGSKAAGERVAGAVLNKLRHPTVEGAGDLRSSVLSVIQHIYDGATAGEEMVDDVASELGQYFSQVKKCTDKPLRKAYQLMRQEGGEAEGDPEYMAQVAKQAIDLLSQQGVEEVESVEEKAPPGAKAERMVKGIKKSLSKDGHLSDKDRAIAYATTWKAKKAGQVEEESSDKKDVPFDGPYRKKGDDKDQFGNKIKHVARHAARQGLADMTTAELKAELKRRSQVEEEESTDTRDQHAEKAGKKVTKDLEYDMKHTGKDDAKAEKAGKKVAKDIEYDDKKDKKKEVEETTVSGSVAPAAGSDAPKKGKGGMQFGQGVYEGQVAESFEKQLKNVLNEGMSVNVSTDDTGKKSISVNATDADADALGDMLKMAGLFSSEGYSRACTDCGGIHEMGACGADMVEEELANSPDEVYTDADYMTQTLSGGLNGPKTTGQTTGPVVNRQDSRQGVMAEAEDEAGTDPTNTKHEGDQGYRDAAQGINKNPYGPNTPAGRAYQAGQAAYKQHFGDIDQERKAARSRAGYYPMSEAERVKTQAESRLWNLYKKI